MAGTHYTTRAAPGTGTGSRRLGPGAIRHRRTGSVHRRLADGGLATSQAWLIAARAVQSAGAAVVAPTALALVSTTFADGKRRNRAVGVYAAISAAGGIVLLALITAATIRIRRADLAGVNPI